MSNIDTRLDLFNQIGKYEAEMTKDDALFVICFNAIEGDLMVALSGSTSFLSGVMANNGGVVNLDSKEDRLRHEQARRMILNMAANILDSDKELKAKFEIALKHVIK